jgi:transcriptional regulator NrdR family protein
MRCPECGHYLTIVIWESKPQNISNVNKWAKRIMRQCERCNHVFEVADLDDVENKKFVTKEKITTSVNKLHNTLTDIQKELLLDIIDLCIEEGASKKQLSPLYAAIYVSTDPPSQKDIERGIELTEKYSW